MASPLFVFPTHGGSGNFHGTMTPRDDQDTTEDIELSQQAKFAHNERMLDEE